MNVNYEHEPQTAKDALNAIPPGCSRETWVKIAMAAKASSLDFEDFVSWSEGADNFKDRKDCLNVWKGIKTNGGIGPGTLFRYAMDAGWTPPKKESATKAVDKAVTSESTSTFWNRCIEATPAHPYIIAKQGNPAGLRVVPSDYDQVIAGHKVTGWLVVPVLSHDSTLRTLQLIPPPGTGKKLNMPGAPFGDGFFIVGDTSQSERLFIVEGIGQAWACWSATGSPAVVCFGAGRMAAVASLLQRHYPTHKRVLAPDRGKEIQAAEIARSASCAWVELPSDKPENYDANDYMAEFGGDELDELLKLHKHPPQRFNLLSAAEVEAIPRSPDLVRGVLPKHGIAAIGGPSGSGKSFVALDMLAAVANGLPWFGHRTNSAPVLYIALEGEAGLGKRLNAYRAKHGHMPERMMFLTTSLDIRDAADLAELIEAIKQHEIVDGVICIDTLNRAAPGMDENASTDMGLVIEALKRIQDALGGLVIVVHHTGKDVTRGLRGHSSLFAALDAVIEVSRDGLQRTWKVAKNKDDEDGKAYLFRLKVVQVDEDDEGEPVTSCYVEPDDSAGSVRRTKIPTSGNQRIIWDALGELFRNAGNIPPQGAPVCLPPGRPALLYDDAIEKLRGRLTDVPPKRHRERTKLAINGLRNRGLIEYRDGFLWCI